MTHDEFTEIEKRVWWLECNDDGSTARAVDAFADAVAGLRLASPMEPAMVRIMVRNMSSEALRNVAQAAKDRRALVDEVRRLRDLLGEEAT